MFATIAAAMKNVLGTSACNPPQNRQRLHLWVCEVKRRQLSEVSVRTNQEILHSIVVAMATNSIHNNKKSMRIAFKVGFPGKYSMLVSFTEKVKFVVNILIQLSHTKNRLVKMGASCCKYMLIFQTYGIPLSLTIRYNF